MVAGRSLWEWSSILVRGIRRGVLGEYIACTIRGSYTLVRRDTLYDYIRNRRGITFAVPRALSPRARQDYLYTIDPLTELSIHPFFRIPNGIFIDIGAFVGKYSLEVARNPACTVLAIEPNPESARLLKKNAAINRCASRITIAPYAVTARPRTVTMSVDGSTSQVVRSSASKATVSVRGLPLRDILQRYAIDPAAVALIKIDVEGEQFAILEQVLRTKQFTRARIICEILPDASRARTLRLLRDCGYRAEQLDDSNYLVVRVYS